MKRCLLQVVRAPVEPHRGGIIAYHCIVKPRWARQVEERDGKRVPKRRRITPPLRRPGERPIREQAANYARVRDTHIEENPDILGGTPVIKRTRLSVYAIRGRLDGGESIDAIIDGYPQLGREAIEAALLYARSHPLVGRPGGRPWTKAA